MRPQFTRTEFAGSLGDLGTLLPIAFGMVLLNGLEGTAVFISIGLYYIIAGSYFGVTVPVQPMKVIGAYAISRSLSPSQITGAGLWMGVILCVLALTGTMDRVRQIVPRSTIRGVQLVTGILLISKGLGFILGSSDSESVSRLRNSLVETGQLGPVPIDLIIGVAAITVILVLLENKYAPASVVVILGGAIVGLLLGNGQGLFDFELGLHLPRFLPFGWPTPEDFVFALVVLALPQLPMTIGNAVIAQADLTGEYFGEELAKRSTPRALSLSMGVANIAISIFGGMPLCHGAGGLAAHYRFGARTAGSNFMIGGIFLVAGLLIGEQALDVFAIVPFPVLGALLAFAGVQLSMMILDINERNDLFVVIAMLSVALVSNLAVGFGVGIVLAYLLKFTKISV